MLCISVVSVVTSPFSFLILLIWVLSLFFLVSLANGLSILFIFSKNQLLVLLIFATVFFVSISFLSTLIFMISFLLLTLGFVCSSFSSFFRCKVRLSILFIFSRNQLLVLLNFAIVFFVSISFISALISMISFLLLTLGFVCSSFSSSFKCKVDCLRFFLFLEVGLYCYNLPT